MTTESPGLRVAVREPYPNVATSSALRQLTIFPRKLQIRHAFPRIGHRVLDCSAQIVAGIIVRDELVQVPAHRDDVPVLGPQLDIGRRNE